jgi:copper chaperone
VTKAVQSVDPSAQVRVDLAKQTVTVESGVSRDKLTTALTSAGYPPH